MSNIYLKVPIETFSKLQFSGFKKFVIRLLFGESEPTQISLNFKTSCYSLKIKGLGAKLCGSSIILILNRTLDKNIKSNEKWSKI